VEEEEEEEKEEEVGGEGGERGERARLTMTRKERGGREYESVLFV
jgi:hypothetical protein